MRRRTAALRPGQVAALVALAVACGQPEPVAPVAVRPEAALRIEPSAVRPGDLATLEISVRTPPDHHLAPWRPPEVADLWILGVEALPVERRGSQWIHELRVRLRPRALGVLHWPESELVVVDALDRETRVPLAGIDLEVQASSPLPSEQSGPYGMLHPEPAADRPSPLAALVWLALGAGLAGFARPLWRRWRSGKASPTGRAGSAPPTGDLFDWALRELDAAAARADAEPLDAARRAARALRAFVARRYEADVLARTTPELAEVSPPFGARSRWPTFVRLLRDLDDLRFRTDLAASIPAELCGRARRSVVECRRFVDEARPDGRRSR